MALFGSDEPVVILTAGIGLGTYIPALLVQRSLAAAGVPAKVHVLEEFYRPEKLEATEASRAAFAENFDLAIIANRMARGVRASLDDARIEELLKIWVRHGRRRFVLWSGYWLPVLQRYRGMIGDQRLEIDFCRIDAQPSASFKAHRDMALAGRDIWLWDGARKDVVHRIGVGPQRAPIAFADRGGLLVHGGGWNLGTYPEAVTLLESASAYDLDIVVRAPDQFARLRPGDRLLCTDPNWRPWHLSPRGEPSFPALGRITKGTVAYTSHDDYHAMYDVVRTARAVVSKPGGGTLIDSLASATPVVLLQPCGEAEASNAAVWQHLGFGIDFEAWRATGFDLSVLERMHEALRRYAPKTRLYPDCDVAPVMAASAVA